MENKNKLLGDELVVLTKQTLDRILKEDNPSDLIALYTFYYYTAKWQGTTKIKSTTNYTATGLKWGRDKVIKNKNKLIKLDLIEDFVRKNDKGVVKGWFIEIKYVLFNIHPPENTTSGELPPVEKSDTNALNTNSINALNTINIADKSAIAETKPTKSGLVTPSTVKPKKEKEENSAKEEKEFNFQEQMDILKTSDVPIKKIIHAYWHVKGYNFDNQGQFNEAFVKQLKHAKQLKPYKGEDIVATMRHLQAQSKNVDWEWKLTTVVKTIDDFKVKNK